MVNTSLDKFDKKKKRIRKKIIGTSERPRLSIYKSARHIYVQIFDDVINPKGSVALVSLTTNNKVNRSSEKNFCNVANAKNLGKQIAEKAKEKGITKVVFDRSGYIYHGIIKIFADSAREGGLIF